MRIILDKNAKKQYQYLINNNEKTIISKITKILLSIQQSPFTGLGKPEPLKGDLIGHWSRRITQKHRLVYRIENNNIIVVQCMFHYDD